MLKNSSLIYIYLFIILANLLTFFEDLLLWRPFTYITLRTLNIAFIQIILQMVYLYILKQTSKGFIMESKFYINASYFIAVFILLSSVGIIVLT